MKVDILTLFPDMCREALGQSMMGRAQTLGALQLGLHDLRDWSTDKHRRVDDEPYGGGQGMVMKCEPIFAAIEALRTAESHVVLLTPQGSRLDQKKVASLTRFPHLILLCGHYEGIDHRVIDALVDAEISIGDYILTNGAIAATVLVDAVVRLLPGVLGDERSSEDESFAAGLLEAPCYTRPPVFRGMEIPAVLTSGHHARITAWKHAQAVARTRQNRPDLLGESPANTPVP
jgi:tRNA (guanine37-N1)-methyltransferase